LKNLNTQIYIQLSVSRYLDNSRFNLTTQKFIDMLACIHCVMVRKNERVISSTCRTYASRCSNKKKKKKNPFSFRVYKSKRCRYPSETGAINVVQRLGNRNEAGYVTKLTCFPSISFRSINFLVKYIKCITFNVQLTSIKRIQLYKTIHIILNF